MIDLTISIVSYNTRDLLKRCLNSIFECTKGIVFEITVIDNASKDGSVDMVRKSFPKVKLIINKENAMFTHANNQALKIAKGKYFLVLNSDTYFKDNSLKKMVDYMNGHPKVGALEGLEIYEDGELIPNGSLFSTPLIDFYELSIIGKRLKNQRVVDKYRLKEKSRKTTFEIDVGCDAFLLVRTDVLKKVGGYDEKFKLYYTENDLCFQIKKQKYKILHFGEGFVMHTVSVSANKLGWKKMDIYYKDLLYYYIKHGYIVSSFALYLLLKIEQLLLKIVRPNMMKR